VSSSSRQRLSREAVLRAAVDLVDREGLEALSMRRLGGAVGIHATSLYNHVEDKEALLDGIIEVVLDEVAAEPGADWKESLRVLAQGFREVSKRHPRVVRVFANRTLASPAWRRSVEDTLAALREGGFGEEEAVNAYRVFWAYLSGYVFAELRLEEAPELRDYLAQLPQDEFPAMHALGPQLAATDRDREYELGVELLLDAFESRLR
jgi:TetR/AcrR family tetracycline transcriptional repressor